MKYTLKNVLFGGETPINKVEPKIINSAVLGENGEVLQEATYDEGGYDTDLELPAIAEGDEAYYVTATLFIGEESNIIPDFQKVVRIVSLNSMNGFDVDKQRADYIDNYLSALNSMSIVEPVSERRSFISTPEAEPIIEKSVSVKEPVAENNKLVENKLSFWQRFLKLFK